MPSASPSLPRYLEIAHDLKKKILAGEFAPGQALPTQKALMDEYSVALMTMRQVLNKLQSEGLVQSRRGKGIFIADHRDRVNALGQVGLAFIDTPVSAASLPQDAMLEAEKLLAHRSLGFALRGFTAGETDQLCAWADRLSGVCLYGAVTGGAVNALTKRGRPVLVLGEMQDVPCPPGVAHVQPDYYAGVEISLGMLWGHGHRSVCLVNRSGHRFWSQIAATGQAFAGSRPGFRLDEIVLRSAEDEARFLDGFQALQPRPTALFVVGGMLACRLMRQLDRVPVRVPEDLSVIALNDRPVHDLVVPELSRVQSDSVKLVHEFVAAMDQLIRTGRMVHKLVPPQLEWGRTVRKIEIDAVR